MRPLIDDGVRDRDPSPPEIDFAACLWVSLSKDGDAARRSLAEKIAYFGSARSPLILERLGLTRADFSALDLALREKRDTDKACSLVDERMLRIGVTGEPSELIRRLEPLVEAGVRHLSFGPDPLEAIELLGREVLPYFRS